MHIALIAIGLLAISPIERPCAEVPEALIPPWPGKPSETGPATPEQMARAQQVALEGPDAGALPPEALLALGHALFAEGRAKEASSSYLGFLKAFPESPFVIDALEALLLLTAESGSREMSYRVLARFAPVMAQLSPERRARTEVFVAAVTGHWAKARCYTHGWHGFTALREYLKLFPTGARARAFVFYSMSPKDGDLDPESGRCDCAPECDRRRSRWGRNARLVAAGPGRPENAALPVVHWCPPMAHPTAGKVEEHDRSCALMTWGGVGAFDTPS